MANKGWSLRFQAHVFSRPAFLLSRGLVEAGPTRKSHGGLSGSRGCPVDAKV